MHAYEYGTAQGKDVVVCGFFFLYFVFLCGIVCNRVFFCVPVCNRSRAGGKMKMVRISENTDSDQKTSSAGKIFTPPLKTKKAQKPRDNRVLSLLMIKKNFT